MEKQIICGCKNCDRPIIALGLCTKHWRRNKLYGSPFVLKSHSGMMKGLSPIERFNKQHQKTDGCWTWTASVDRDGYGSFKGMVGTVLYQKAHRFSWAYHNKTEVPQGMMVCHKCDNPRCVNPAHLWLGSGADNQRDMRIKGRGRFPNGEIAPGAILAESQVREILADCRPYATIAADYGVAATTISSIKTRKSWAHLKVEFIGHAPRVSPKRGKSDRITPEIVREIRSSDMSGKSLAEKFAVSAQLICAIRKRRLWNHVT